MVVGGDESARIGGTAPAAGQYSRIGADQLLTPREVTRDFVTLLNLLQQNPGQSFATLLHGPEFKPSQPVPDTEMVPPGTLVRIELPWFPGEQPASMLAKFVRTLPDGCALRFADPDPFLRVFVKLGLLQSQCASEPRPASSGTRF